MVRKLVVFLTAGILMLSTVTANALGFGTLKLNSALNERFDAEVELLSVTPADIESLKVGLAPDSAFLRAGIERTAIHSSLLFDIKQHSNGDYYIHVSSKGTIREPFVNFLMEMNWKNGRMLREFTVLLDPPAARSQKQQQPVVMEAPSTTAPQLVEQQETAQQETPSPFVEAPATPVTEEPMPEPEKAADEQLPRVDISDSKEPVSEEIVEVVPEAEKETPPAKEPTVAAEPEPWPVTPEPEKETAGADTSVSQVFEDDELFPRIPLTSYDEAKQPVVTGELDYGITAKNDNLWTIAEKMRPANVTIYQMMMALLQANPDAFVDGNVHRLKVGHVLRISDPKLLTSISAKQAASEYQSQTQQWDEYRQQMAARVEEQPVIATQVEEETPATAEEASGELTLETPETTDNKTGAGASEEAISNDLAALKAELEQLRQQAKASGGKDTILNTRIKDLENKLASMERSISIKDNEMAALQSQLAEQNKQAETTPAEPEQPEAVSDATEAMEAEQPQAEATDAEQVTETGKATTTEQAAAEKTEPAKQQPTPPKPPVVTQTTPAPAEDDFMGIVMGILNEAGNVVSGMTSGLGGSSMMLYVGGPALIVLLILIMIVVKRRRQETFQESILRGSPSTTDSGSDIPSADLATSEESSFLSDFAVSGAGAIQTEDSEVDPLTEADVFMAYGRHEAAEERLQEAIQNDPNREELHLKLLELYNTTQNAEAFETSAETFYATLGGNASGNPSWEKVVAMGSALVPTNPLFSGGAAPMAEASAQDSGALQPAGDDATLAMTDSQVMDIGLETGVFQADDFATSESEAEPAESNDMDFNFDLGGSGETPAAEESMDMNFDLGGTTETTEEPGMDFDLDLGGSSAEEPAMDFDMNLGGEESTETASADTGMDFNLDLGAADETAESEPAMDFSLDMDSEPAMDMSTESEIGFDLDLGGAEDTAEVTIESPSVENDSTMMMDMSGMDLDTGSSDDAAIDLGLDASDSTDFDMSSDSDEVGTKLDLAKAYIEMGDPEGARSILDEVLDEGNEQQKAEAQQIMQEIA